MELTTIQVRVETRDRIKKVAQEKGMKIHRLADELLNDCLDLREHVIRRDHTGSSGMPQ